ncbi:MAG: hypothetical protein ACOYOS_00135 [Syntrophales bacterium]
MMGAVVIRGEDGCDVIATPDEVVLSARMEASQDFRVTPVPHLISTVVSVVEKDFACAPA